MEGEAMANEPRHRKTWSEIRVEQQAKSAKQQAERDAKSAKQQAERDAKRAEQQAERDAKRAEQQAKRAEQQAKSAKQQAERDAKHADRPVDGAVKRNERQTTRLTAAGTCLVVTLPHRMEEVLLGLLSPGEAIHIKIKGSFQEALVCTDYRVIILKRGFMTGQLFGNDIFQFPYSGIAGAQVKWHLGSGFFELNSGGMQNTPKSYWSNNKYGGTDAKSSPNSVSLNSKEQADAFRQACSFIMAKINPTAEQQPQQAQTLAVADEIAKLLELRNCGALTQEEFEAQKARILQ